MICVNSACRGSAYGSSLLTHSTRGPRKVRAGYEMTAWEGRFGEDAERDGLRVPVLDCSSGCASWDELG